MGIRNWRHRGRARLVLSKVWPDGTRFRRFMPNRTVAKGLEKKIDYAVAMGTWRSLKDELLRGPEAVQTVDPTVAVFAAEYLAYCASRNRDLAFKERQVKHLTRVVGGVRLGAFKRRDADRFVDARRKAGASNATINRGLAVLKHLLTLAVERDYVGVHPLARYRLLPEVQAPLRILGYDEYRCLVDAVTRVDPVVGAYTVFLGETGARKQEGLSLEWDHVDVARRVVSLGYTKSGKTRSVPLSEYCLESLDGLVRFIGMPYVFVDAMRQRRWRDPRGPFQKGCEEAGLTATFHDLRHFRATQWLMHGVDVNTVKELLGHSSIQTTMRYAHYVQTHAAESVATAQAREYEQWAAQHPEVATKWRHRKGKS